jgi:hypothetical protein
MSIVVVVFIIIKVYPLEDSHLLEKNKPSPLRRHLH